MKYFHFNYKHYISHVSFIGEVSLIFISAFSPFMSFGDNAPTLQDTRSVIKEWVLVEKIISGEEVDWDLKKNLLENQIEILKCESQHLKERLFENEGTLTRADTKRNALLEREGESETHIKMLSEEIAVMETHVLHMQGFLPDVLKLQLEAAFEKISLLSQGDDSYQLTLRVQNLFSILTAIWEFDDAMTTARAFMRLESGEEAEVDIVYAGLGQAWYVGTSTAGFGFPTAAGWQWMHDNTIAEKVTQAIQMVKEQSADIDWLLLPVQLPEEEQA